MCLASGAPLHGSLMPVIVHSSLFLSILETFPWLPKRWFGGSRTSSRGKHSWLRSALGDLQDFLKLDTSGAAANVPYLSSCLVAVFGMRMAVILGKHRVGAPPNRLACIACLHSLAANALIAMLHLAKVRKRQSAFYFGFLKGAPATPTQSFCLRIAAVLTGGVHISWLIAEHIAFSSNSRERLSEVMLFEFEMLHNFQDLTNGVGSPWRIAKAARCTFA